MLLVLNLSVEIFAEIYRLNEIGEKKFIEQLFILFQLNSKIIFYNFNNIFLQK